MEGHYGTRGEYTALRYYDWKLIRLPSRVKYQLFNLRNDPGETRDLSKNYRYLVRLLAIRMQEYEKNFAATVQEDLSCPELSFEITPWNQLSWKPWCSD